MLREYQQRAIDMLYESESLFFKAAEYIKEHNATA